MNGEQQPDFCVNFIGSKSLKVPEGPYFLENIRGHLKPVEQFERIELFKRLIHDKVFFRLTYCNCVGNHVEKFG
jgi:hypothetical protein